MPAFVRSCCVACAIGVWGWLGDVRSTWNGCESGAGCLRAPSCPIGVKKKLRQFGASGHSVRFASPALERAKPLPGILFRGEILATMPCMPCRSPASCFLLVLSSCCHRVVIFAMLFFPSPPPLFVLVSASPFLLWHRSRHAFSFIEIFLLLCSPSTPHHLPPPVRHSRELSLVGPFDWNLE